MTGAPRPGAVAAGPDALRRRGFAVVTAALGLFLFAAAAPTPLYGLYATRWGFSTASLTAVFAVYALALLATLLLLGPLSDAVGRRPVVLAGLGLQAVAMALFLAAGSLGWLYAARTVQGLATGLVTAALAAALIDLQPADRPGRGAVVNAVTPAAGLAAGALAAAALVQYAPAPTRLVYALLLVACALLAACLALVPETVTVRRRPGLHVGLGVEPAARPAFLAVLPALVATWALGGLYLSLGPSIASALTGSSNRLVGGVAVALLAGVGALTSLAVAHRSGRSTLLLGCTALAAGALVTVGALLTSTAWVFFVGTTVAGAGFGAGFLGAFRTLAGLASPGGRGALVATVYVVAYLAFSLPAVLAGLLADHVGLRATGIGYGTGVGVLAVLAAAGSARATGEG
ncbi:MFS transporter [Kineococcus sp. LSe6-4]|uniref:MFS transporter n=1 Tax=Kineococcus halophytocola TaxID=3234027 RepID=A0ABV4H1J5_9ACTN